MFKGLAYIFVFTMVAALGLHAEESQANQIYKANYDFLQLYNKASNTKKVLDKEKSVERNLLNTDIRLSMKPLIRAVAAIDKIYVHPLYQTRIYTPQGTIVTECTSSVALAAAPEKSYNMCTIQPDLNFIGGNLNIIYKNIRSGEEDMYSMSIYIEPYPLIGRDEKLHTIVYYVQPEHLEDSEVIKKYHEALGTYPTEKISYFNYKQTRYSIELVSIKDGNDIKKIKDSSKGTISMVLNEKTYTYKIERGEVNE